MSGCHGVSEWINRNEPIRSIASTVGAEMNVDSHANNVEKNAAIAMLA